MILTLCIYIQLPLHLKILNLLLDFNFLRHPFLIIDEIVGIHSQMQIPRSAVWDNKIWLKVTEMDFLSQLISRQKFSLPA